MLNRREWLRTTLTGAALTIAARRLPAAPYVGSAVKVTVYKSATCGCCRMWVDYMRANGFTVEAHDVADAKLEEIKDTVGVPRPLRSCHVALVGPFVLEGHVPADLVRKALAEKPKILGLAVPGMPAGSPGMEMGGRKDPFDVIAFERGGKSWVYAHR